MKAVSSAIVVLAGFVGLLAAALFPAGHSDISPFGAFVLILSVAVIAVGLRLWVPCLKEER